MSPAELSLVKHPPEAGPDIEDAERLEDQEEGETEEVAPLPTRLALVAGRLAGAGAALLVLNIGVGLVWHLHQLRLATWVLLVLYAFVGGGLYRLAREREQALRALALHWAQYQVWAIEEAPDAWERATKRARTVRGWVWQSEDAQPEDSATVKH